MLRLPDAPGARGLNASLAVGIDWPGTSAQLPRGCDKAVMDKVTAVPTRLWGDGVSSLVCRGYSKWRRMKGDTGYILR